MRSLTRTWRHGIGFPAAIRLANKRAFEVHPTSVSCSQARLLIDRAYTGSILGKGGSIISDIRRKTKASIRLLSPAPCACASRDDELVEVHHSLLIDLVG